MVNPRLDKKIVYLGVNFKGNCFTETFPLGKIFFN